VNPKSAASYCGLACEECDAFVATKNNDNQLKTQVAVRWSRLYNKKIEAKDVFCKGCKSSGTKGIYCQAMCRIKPCCRKKGFNTCAPCPQFPCQYSKEVFAFCPGAEARGRGIS